MAWVVVFVTKKQKQVRSMTFRDGMFLILSGIATGASWLCYYRALQLGDINKVVPIDKSSTVLTILLAFFLLGEPIGLPQGIGVVLIGTGTFLMLEKRSPAAGCAPQCGSWMLYAFGSAVFASLTAILGKAGIQGVESNLGTAIRTGVVLVMAWLMVLVTGKAGAVRQVPRRELAFICLSGVATGASWLCYFRALQLGEASKVAPIDKSSTILTVLIAIVCFSETEHLAVKLTGTALLAVGIYLMVERKAVTGGKASGGRWLVYAVFSAVFAALTSILAKVGIEGIESNLGTAIRTVVVLIMAWVVVFVKGRQAQLRSLDRREALFIALSGIATGASWLCYYYAIQNGVVSVVVPIDKMSILVTVIFSALFLKEKVSRKAAAFFLQNLPADFVPYWDFTFNDHIPDIRDSSAASIFTCGLLELAQHADNAEAARDRAAARTIVRSLYDHYFLHDPDRAGVLTDAIYHRDTGATCVIWGDYFFYETLLRLLGGDKCFW